MAAVSALVALAPAPAQAGTVPVQIDSKPAGATLYLDSRDSEPLGRTPFKGALEEGTYTLIVELDGYEASVQTIRVKKPKSGKLAFTAELERVRSATLEIEAGNASANGASIVIDGVEQGQVPGTVTVLAGPHQVEVTKAGFKPFEAWVEPTEGQSLKVKVNLVKGGGKPPPDDGGDETGDGGDETGDGGDDSGDGDTGDGGDDTGDGGDDTGDGGDDAEPPIPANRPPIVKVGVSAEFSSRRFAYKNGTTENLRDYTATAVPIGRLLFELYPLARGGSDALAGIGVVAQLAQAAPLNSKTADGKSIATTWSEYDLAARYQYTLGTGGGHVGAEVAFGGQSIAFTLDNSTREFDGKLPEVSYRYLRIGADGRYGFGALALTVGAGFRHLLAIGPLGDRFATAKGSGLGGEVGVAYAFASQLEATLGVDAVRYTLKFTDSAMYQADGATDLFFTFGVGITYRF